MLFSLILKFFSKTNIYFDYYPGEALHGMFFNLLKKNNQLEATRLHENYDNKPFTISPIQPYLKWIKGRRMLKAEKKYFIRLTFLEDKWYQLFVSYFLNYSKSLQLNGNSIEVEKILTNSDHNQCNTVESNKLIEQAQKKKKISLKFHSLTTFREDNKHIIFPQEEYVFNSLLGKWKIFGNKELRLTSEDFKNIRISRYKLETKMEEFSGYPIKGFQGNCQYELNENLSEQKLQEINFLSDFAFYCGVGYKTTMGLGQVNRIDNL